KPHHRHGQARRRKTQNLKPRNPQTDPHPKQNTPPEKNRRGARACGRRALPQKPPEAGAFMVKFLPLRRVMVNEWLICSVSCKVINPNFASIL
ncbi:hypothetical protein, partial [Stappia sp. P2PMeth1]|uniref:hypothetical protein n=1 Tax=Stappia sp. P2PMeth1 TaxID=2003586 RepID=UPI001AD8D036